MGNYVSCTPTAFHGKQSRTTKVVFPTGELRQFDGPVYAAELMLDAPNHFLVSTRSMQVGRQFSPLSADEELETSGAYAMFPMKRVNSVVTATDMAAPWMATGSEVGRRPSGSLRIRPETVQGSPERCDPVGVGGMSEAPWPSLKGALVGESMHGLTACRSRKPVLETINEESICSI